MPPKVDILKERVKHLEKELRHKQLIISSIHEIGKALSSELRIDKLLPLIMEEVTRIIDAERSTFYVVDHERGEIWSKIAQKAEISEIRLKIGVGIAGHVAKTGETVNIQDAYSDPRFDPSTDQKTGYRTRSVLCMPIFEPVSSKQKTKPKILAVIQALNKKSGVFTHEDEELMASLGAQLAITLVNSKLYLSLEKRVQELNLLYLIEQEASSTEKEDTLYQRLIQKLVNTFKVEAGLIAFFDNHNKTFGPYYYANIPESDIKKLDLAADLGIERHVLSKKEIYYTNCAPHDPLYLQNQPSGLKLKIDQLICAPLIINNQPVGIIQLYNKVNKNDIFLKDDVKILTSASRQISRLIEARRLREEKIKAERLATIGNMLSTIVHDLRTPMNNIYGFVDLMRDEEDPQLRNEYADIVIKQIGTLNNMAHDVLDFAKGKTNILPVKYPVNKILDDFRKLFENEIKKQGYQFEVECKASCMLYVDPDKIIRVFMNIMKNALEAMDKGGKFSIKAFDRGDEVEFQLSDTGKGIPPEIKNRLFESFVTSGKKEGTGLGLAIVKNLVDQHKGRIEVDSTPGKGTTFKLYFKKL
ncbi:MAG: GAF domain-containing protein [Caldisericaceae bacterium]|nr:GAF domain-containing protein [Caldisericaceae bacterium]